MQLQGMQKKSVYLHWDQPSFALSFSSLLAAEMRNLLCMVPSTRSTWSLTWDCIDFSWQVGSWSKKQDLKVVIVWQARANWRHNDGQKFIFRFFRPGYRQCMTEHSNALSRKIRLHILVIDDEHVPREILKIISTCSRKRRCSSYISTSSLKQIIPCKQKILKKISCWILWCLSLYTVKLHEYHLTHQLQSLFFKS